MEWPLVLLIIFGSLLFLMALGMPVAFCFVTINVVGMFLLLGGEAGLRQLALSFYDSLTTFVLLPLALFILMGEVIFQSGVGTLALDTLDKWLGRLPGRLALIAVAGGTIIATLTGEAVGSIAILGSTLVPEMEKRGYKKPMSLGPIIGSAGLAPMIPPSSLAVFVGAIAMISIGKILIGIIIPGLLMAALYASYILVRCKLQPSLAPAYTVSLPSLSDRLIALAKYILPLGFIIFLVIGVMLIGVATPSEAAATGALGCFILAAAYRNLNWRIVKTSVGSALVISTMIYLIILGAQAFGQILSYSGVTKGVVQWVINLHVAPILVFIALQVVVVFLGMFMPTGPIVMVCVPLFMPVIQALGFDPVWFAVVLLINLQLAQKTPPYGISLFVMKGVAPSDTTMGDIIRATVPFLFCDIIAMVLAIAFPTIVLWLPNATVR